MEGATKETASPDPTKHTAFIIGCLDSSKQRTAVNGKIREFITSRYTDLDANEDEPVKIVHLGQIGWESVGAVASPTYHVVSLCRKYGLLPTERSVMLSVHDQYQIIQVCLARINKKRHGEFMAAASDVLDVWNQMYQSAITCLPETNDEDTSKDILPKGSQSIDPCVREMTEIIDAYNDFVQNSGCFDHFMLYKLVKKHVTEGHDILKEIASKVYILEAVSQLPIMERELVKILLQNAEIFRVTVSLSLVADTSGTNFDLDMSGIGDVDALPLSQESKDKQEEEEKGEESRDNEQDALEVVSLEGSLIDYLSQEPKDLCLGFTCSESELYVEQLVVSHLRLLVNTRDELALTTTCSIPGREISQQGFYDIKEEAQKKNMPMYQTVLSFIMKLRLGGKGYQPDPDNPVLLHAKPLGEFVDSIMKLQSVIEEEPDIRKAALKVLSLIKSGLLRMRGCVLKKATIEQVWGKMNTALFSLLDLHDGGVPTKQTKGLRPCLRVLLQLCDEVSSHASATGIVDALGEHFLTQCSSSRKTQTPIRIPTVLSLFRSPAEAKEAHADEDDTEENLRVRLMKKKGIMPKTEMQQQRFKSTCAWAPEDLSPVRPNMAGNSLSPIVGPTLKAVGKGRQSSQNWREIVNSMPNREDDSSDASVGLKESTSGTDQVDTEKEKSSAKEGEEVKTKKKCSKRSLLSDISNVTSEPTAKKSKSDERKQTKEKAPSKKSAKTKPIPKGQKSITSFFKS